jgi:hypothetical protein
MKTSKKPLSQDPGGSFRKCMFPWYAQGQAVLPRAPQRNGTSPTRTGKRISRLQLVLFQNTLKNISIITEEKSNTPQGIFAKKFCFLLVF